MILQFLSIIISLEIVDCGPIALVVDTALIWLKLRNIQRWIVNAYTMVIKSPDFRAPLLICLSSEYRILLGSRVGTMGVCLLLLDGIDEIFRSLHYLLGSLRILYFGDVFARRYQSADGTSTLGRD